MKNDKEKTFKKHKKTRIIDKNNYSNDEAEDERISQEMKSKKFNKSYSKKWYDELKISANLDSKPLPYEDVQNLRKQGSSIYSEAVIIHGSKPPQSLTRTDYAWIKTVMAKGTKTDKVAAYSLLIQDCALYNLNFLKSMIEMVKVGKNKECFMAVDALCELFLNDLLPPNRKLLTFAEQPLSKLDDLVSEKVNRRRILLLWYFEDQLKSIYGDFISNLIKISHDSVEANKQKVITTMSKLLEGNPEKEEILLNSIVNKLGDPSHKVGSKVIFVLMKLLQAHSNMREVVAEAVEKVIFRTNISKRAQYYSVCFLSQFCFFSEDSQLAKKLISIYLSLFKACIKTGEIDSRMMSALLAGVKRAFPFVKEEYEMLKEQVNTLYKIIHLSHANIAIQALCLVQLISSYSSAHVDRFYSVLYKKIGETELFQSSHHAMLINLLFKALKQDNEKNRICAFIKRILELCTFIPVPVACGLLILVSQVIKRKEDVLIKEMIPSKSLEIKLEDEDTDGEEHYKDVIEEPEINAIKEEEKKENNKLPTNIFNVHLTEDLKVWSNPDKSVENAKDAVSREYNPLARNPLYAGAQNSFYVELNRLSQHYHPTVSLFANTIIKGEGIAYTGDPLLDFTLIRFLDKLSFKNPKVITPEEDRNMTFVKFNRKKYYSADPIRRLRANTADYLNHSEKNIPVDEIFLFKYMKEKAERIPTNKKIDTSDAESVGSVGSEEFDEIISGLADGKKDDIDFLRELGQLPKKDKKKEEKEESDAEDGDLDDEDGSEDEAQDFDGDEAEEFSFDDMGDSDMDEAELEASGIKLPKIISQNKNKHKNKSENKLLKKNKIDKNNWFAPAEEFAELLEEESYEAGGSEALSNKDKAATKQLKWESDRDKWINKKNYKRGVKRSNLGKKR